MLHTVFVVLVTVAAVVIAVLSWRGFFQKYGHNGDGPDQGARL